MTSRKILSAKAHLGTRSLLLSPNYLNQFIWGVSTNIVKIQVLSKSEIAEIRQASLEKIRISGLVEKAIYKLYNETIKRKGVETGETYIW